MSQPAQPQPVDTAKIVVAILIAAAIIAVIVGIVFSINASNESTNEACDIYRNSTLDIPQELRDACGI